MEGGRGTVLLDNVGSDRAQRLPSLQECHWEAEGGQCCPVR